MDTSIQDVGPPGRKSRGEETSRGVDGEGEDDAQDDDYEDEGDHDDADGQTPEQPEEDPSGSVNQTHQQITMCVRDQKASRTERHCSESHRVDEIKFVREISIDRGKRS